MKQLRIGIVLLLIVLVIGIWVSITMQTVHRQISGILWQAAVFAQQGDFSQSNALAQDAYTQWQRHWRGIAACADHAPMDEIDSVFAELRAYASSDQTQELAACCARLSSLVNAIAESQRFSWWNLL